MPPRGGPSRNSRSSRRRRSWSRSWSGLEDQHTGLDEALALWERGEALHAYCQAKLDSAAHRIERLKVSPEEVAAATEPDAGKDFEPVPKRSAAQPAAAAPAQPAAAPEDQRSADPEQAMTAESRPRALADGGARRRCDRGTHTTLRRRPPQSPHRLALARSGTRISRNPRPACSRALTMRTGTGFFRPAQVFQSSSGFWPRLLARCLACRSRCSRTTVDCQMRIVGAAVRSYAWTRIDAMRSILSRYHLGTRAHGASSPPQSESASSAGRSRRAQRQQIVSRAPSTRTSHQAAAATNQRVGA